MKRLKKVLWEQVKEAPNCKSRSAALIATHAIKVRAWRSRPPAAPAKGRTCFCTTKWLSGSRGPNGRRSGSVVWVRVVQVVRQKKRCGLLGSFR